MRVTLVLVVLAIGALMLAGQPVASQSEAKKQAKQAAGQKKVQAESQQKGAAPAVKKTAVAPPVDRSADEQAVRASVDAFVKAYNSGNAKALAELFAPDGQILTEDGETLQGREAIEEGFKEILA